MKRDEIRRLADEDLMALVDRKDPIAFEAFFDRHGGASYSLAHRIVGEDGTAEDVTQETFLNQLWVREGNVMHPPRAFTLDEHNRAEAEIAELPPGADEVLVTREPHPGRKQPSSAPLLRAPLG